MTMDEVEKLKAENDALRKRMEKLESQVNPPPRQPYNYQPVDRTEGMGMDRATMQAMIDAVPESVMAELRADTRRPNPVTEASSSTVRSTPSAQSQRQRQGWVEPRPLEPPPGVAIADRLMDAQDEIDRAELAMKFAKARMGKGDVK
jgi:hypothetical protein